MGSDGSFIIAVEMKVHQPNIILWKTNFLKILLNSYKIIILPYLRIIPYDCKNNCYHYKSKFYKKNRNKLLILQSITRKESVFKIILKYSMKSSTSNNENFDL